MAKRRFRKRTTLSQAVPASSDKAGYWDPNRRSFDEGRPYVEAQLRKVGLDPDERIITSKDLKSKRIRPYLKTLNSPPGFDKWQLPFSFFHPTNVYVTVGKPGTRVPSHSHDEGPGMRYIITGSITLGRNRLGPGDWVYIPRGKKYSFTVGSRGVQFVASYEC